MALKMANFSSFSFLVSIAFLAVIHNGTSLKCFKCFSPFGGFCDEMSEKNPPPVETCKGEMSFCYHYLLNEDATKEYPFGIWRGCTSGRHCRDVEQSIPVKKICLTCDLNLCNNATLYHKPPDSSNGKGSSSRISCSQTALLSLFAFILFRFAF